MKATKGIILSVQLSMGIAFLMTQGCITAKPEGKNMATSGHHKGPFGYYPPRQSKAEAQVPSYQDDLMSSTDSFDNGPIVGSQSQGPSTYTPPVHRARSQSEVYIVKKGDILSRLAVRFHSTTKELASLNNLSNPNTLYVGQELQVPASSGSYSSKSRSSSAKKGKKYEIRKGDTLSRIAVAANVSIDELRSVNNIKNDRIFAGEIIYIPKGGKLPSPRKTKVPKKSPPPMKAPEALAPTDTTSTSTYTAPPPLESLEPVQEVVVEAGDSLALIAKRNNTTKAEIMRLNGITDETTIRNGQRLRVPIQK